MITLHQIQNDRAQSLTLPDMSSLDAITRQLPDGYYSTFRTFDGCTRVIGLSAHLRRLPNIDGSSLRRNLLLLLEPYRPGEARVRLILTKQGELYISIEPLKLLTREIYENGVEVETTLLYRNDPRVKSTAFIGVSNDERKHIAQQGIFEALLVKNGKILEGMTSNFFYIMDDILYTAQRDILLGVTRTMVIRAARGIGMEVRYRPLKLDQLPAVKEAFITSSSRGIVPVIQIDAVKVGRRKVGQTTMLLMKAYDEYVLKQAEKI
ncbi:MAG: aminotransferase class IV [Anaerolineales bacterium]